MCEYLPNTEQNLSPWSAINFTGLHRINLILLVHQQTFFWNDCGSEYFRGISLFITIMVQSHSFKQCFNVIATTFPSPTHSFTIIELYNSFFPSISQSLAMLSEYVLKSGVFRVSKLVFSTETLGRKGHISSSIFEEYVNRFITLQGPPCF